MIMTRMQMIKALQERGWGKAAPEELEKCYTYKLRRVLLQDERVGGIYSKEGFAFERRRKKEGKEAAGGKDHRFFSDSRRAWNKLLIQ